MFDEVLEVLEEELSSKRIINTKVSKRSFIYREVKEILRNLTGTLKTCCWKELSQSLEKCLIEGLHLRTFLVKSILEVEHI